VAVEAGGTAAQPMEQAGITEDVIQKLQERATVLTQERKRRGRSVPEDLMPQDNIRSFQTLASHPVSISFIYFIFLKKCIVLLY
jgi:pre-mRNA-processing factor 19